MRRGWLTLMTVLLLAGCRSGEKLPAQQPADHVKITTLAGLPRLQQREINDKERIAALVAFVNSLPDGWGVPWYGPRVGKVYFEFEKGHRGIGRFFVGPDFFGRDVGKPYTQSAGRKAIEEVGRIADVDLWAYVNSEAGAAQAAAPAAPAAPTPRPTAPAPKPAAATPTGHP
jgi:hypothetical protein